MNKEVILVLISDYADWEASFLAAALNGDIFREGKNRFPVKTLSLNKDAVYSCGGFKVVPDYDIHSLPSEYAALVLISGTSWRSDEAKLVLPLVEDAIEKSAILGGICDASLFLGMNGFLNEVKHTSNTLEDLKMSSGSNYIGEANYLMQQAVSDRGIVTANGTAYLEFTKEILLLLDIDTSENIENFYQEYKFGYYNQLK